MRDAFCRSLVAHSVRPEFVFLTGDLGFKALEPLRDALAERFINAGVAEQNMVSVGAALAHAGMKPWVYSIAPFAYARPYEQIRNDICLHRLPVAVVGNGGGYGYGVMGATHHALEDYGALTCLPHLRAYVPAFDPDVASLVDLIFGLDHPSYLRLGYSEPPAGCQPPPYSPWRQLVAGCGWVVLAVGPLAGPIWAAFRELKIEDRPSLWLLSELPPPALPAEFLDDLARAGRLLVVEEHVEQGGAGQMIASRLLKLGCAPRHFATRHALGYPGGRYGSQAFHRRECGLDAASILNFLLEHQS